MKFEIMNDFPDKVRDENHFAETQGIRTLEKNYNYTKMDKQSVVVAPEKEQ